MARWLVGLSALALSGCFNGLLLTPVDTGSPVSETVVREAKRPVLCCNKVAIIDVDGIILNARTGGLLGEGDNMRLAFREQLDAAADDPNVKAVVLRINSPGGAVTASDIMYQDVIRFRATRTSRWWRA